MEFTEKEIALISQIKTDAESLIQEKTNGLISEQKFTEKLNELKSSSDASSAELKEQIAKLTDIAKEQGLKMQSYNSNPQEANSTAIKSDLEAVKEFISKGAKGELALKANYTRASVTNSTQAMRLNDFGQIGTRRLAMYDLFPKMPVSPDSNGIVRYQDWDEATTVRAAASISEGAAFPESTATFQEYTLPLQKIGDTLPITEEVMLYAPRFEAELNRFLTTNVDVIIDTQLTSGSGTAPNLRGIYTAAPTYTAVASGIADANIYDLIIKTSEAITSTKGGKYAPNFAMMNIVDINKMKLKKDTTQNYLVPPFTTQGGMYVDNMIIVENNAMTANTLVVGDTNFATIWEQGGLMVATGTVGTQFAADLMTLKVKKFLALLVRKADETGFRKVTSISAALTTLAT
jgi:hypothetical protein